MAKIRRVLINFQQPELLKYLEKYWLGATAVFKKECWAGPFVQDAIVLFNMHIENFHKILKYVLFINFSHLWTFLL